MEWASQVSSAFLMKSKEFDLPWCMSHKVSQWIRLPAFVKWDEISLKLRSNAELLVGQRKRTEAHRASFGKVFSYFSKYIWTAFPSGWYAPCFGIFFFVTISMEFSLTTEYIYMRTARSWSASSALRAKLLTFCEMSWVLFQELFHFGTNWTIHSVESWLGLRLGAHVR